MTRGFFGIGIVNGKTQANIGTLWRSASLYNAAFIFTVGSRYDRQASDTMSTPLHTPLLAFDTVDDLIKHLPHGCPLVGVEMDPRAVELTNLTHPVRACYLLGAEDRGLSPHVLDRCHLITRIATPRPMSMNVASAGALLLHDRHTKSLARTAVNA